MSRPLRFLPRGHMVEVTLRTIQGRLLLRPTRGTNDLIAGAIGRAQRKTSMEIHAVVAMSNHIHLLISPQDVRHMARFMNQVGSNIARKVGTRVGWREKFWGRRYHSIVVSDEEMAQVARLRYLLAHGAKEGFVASPLDWPGVHPARPLVDGSMTIEGSWHDGSTAYRDRQASRPNSTKTHTNPESVRLSPLPCWRSIAQATYCHRIAELVGDIERETRAGHRRSRTAPLGVARVLAMHPHKRPMKVKQSPAPAFHAASTAARRHLRRAYAWFVASYRTAAAALQRGEWPVTFPKGCFPPALPFVPE